MRQVSIGSFIAIEHHVILHWFFADFFAKHSTANRNHRVRLWLRATAGYSANLKYQWADTVLIHAIV